MIKAKGLKWAQRAQIQGSNSDQFIHYKRTSDRTTWYFSGGGHRHCKCRRSGRKFTIRRKAYPALFCWHDMTFKGEVIINPLPTIVLDINSRSCWGVEGLAYRPIFYFFPRGWSGSMVMGPGPHPLPHPSLEVRYFKLENLRSPWYGPEANPVWVPWRNSRNFWGFSISVGK